MEAKKLVTYERTPLLSGSYDVYAYNGVFIGNFLIEVDGYYNWWPVKERDGYVPAHMLRALADALDEINKEWDETIQTELEKLNAAVT